MDSEHRHELKTNELADWIGHAPQYLRENARTIIGAALIVIAVITWPMFKKIRVKADLEQKAQTTDLIEQSGQAKLMVLQDQMRGGGSLEALVLSANSLQIAADEAESDQLAALALISRGEALRADLHYKTPDPDVIVIEDRIKKANKAYEQAIEKAGGNVSLAAMATYGLGLCAEDMGDFDEAGRIYKSIVENTDFEGTVFQARAGLRLEDMEDSKGVFVFVDAPKEVAPEGLDPLSIEPGLLDDFGGVDILAEPETSGQESEQSESQADTEDSGAN
jgi:tetratricopeptide (TPR) repeat protein